MARGGHSNIMELRIRVNKNVEKGSDFGRTASSTFLQKRDLFFTISRKKGVNFEQRPSPIRGHISDFQLPDQDPDQACKITYPGSHVACPGGVFIASFVQKSG